MTTIRIHHLASIALLAGLTGANVRGDALFLTRGTDLVRLEDRTGDGDFLDSGEVVVYASSLLPSTGGLVVGPGYIHVLLAGSRTLVEIRDLNADGDAVDTGEVRTFAVTTDQATQTLIGLAAQRDGSLLTIGGVTNLLYRIQDANGDGDALDAGEIGVIASGLASARGIMVRSDARLLVAHNSMSIPVRILRDRTGDGDFSDFAENISYIENLSPGDDILAMDSRTAYLARSTDGRILKLQDLTGDDDALDAGEVVTFAEGLGSAKHLAPDGAGGLYVAASDAAGSLYHVRDLNGDADALDFGEAIIVATGLTNPNGIALQDGAPIGCRKGDVDLDQDVDLDDAHDLVEVLLGIASASDPCTADCNSDGRLDGRDLPGFVGALLGS